MSDVITKIRIAARSALGLAHSVPMRRYMVGGDAPDEGAIKRIGQECFDALTEAERALTPSDDEPFKIREPYSWVDKHIEIEGPDGLGIMVDYDDVDHPVIEAAMKKMVATLNAHWKTDG